MGKIFQIAWMGGVAEHHFRRVRPSVDIAWHDLDPTRYRPQAVQAAQRVWTSLALSEYAAISGFAQVVRALAEAQAPLDLIGMTSDFLADEVRHVELASHVVMRLGGAHPMPFEPARLGHASDGRLSAFARANELALKVGCIGEAFAGATALPIMRATGNPVLRAVYETILRDEARHCRFGSLYFEWANELIDEAERRRLADVALATLTTYARLGRSANPPPQDDTRTANDEEALELGWFGVSRYGPLVREVIAQGIVPELEALGLPIDRAQVAALFSE